MNLFRFIISFPLAFSLSFVGWATASVLLLGASYGGGWSIAPLVITTAIPAMLFVPMGVFIAPSRKRISVFIFFGLSLVFSGGVFECYNLAQVGYLKYDKFAQFAQVSYWTAAFTGVILGSIFGLYFGLRIQKRRKFSGSDQPAARGGAHLPLGKRTKCIIIAVIVTVLGVGGYFLMLLVIFVYGMLVQMNAGREVLDGLNTEKIKTWESRSLTLWEKHKGHYGMGVYGMGRLPIPRELAELKILRIDIYDDRIDYVWCGGMDHCTLIVEKRDDGYMHFTAEYDDENQKEIFRIPLKKKTPNHAPEPTTMAGAAHL